MTLIAYCSISGMPYLLGDLLLTRKAAPGLDIRVPTIPWGDARNKEIIVDNLGPAGLVQKINICSDDLVIAWAGKAKTAQEIICEIKAKHHEKRFDILSMGEYFSELPESVVDEITLIGLIAGDGQIVPFSYAKLKHEVEHADYGTLWLGGSGSDMFLKHQKTMVSKDIDEVFGDFADVDLNYPAKPDQPPSSVILKSEYKIQMLAGLMLTVEMSTLNTLKSYFGGGFEVSWHNGIRFAKQPITYLYWLAELGANNTHRHIAIAPIQAFNYSYKEDVLYLKTIYFNHNEQSVFDELFPIPPIYRSITDAEERPAQIVPDFQRVMSIVLIVKNGQLMNGSYYIHGSKNPILDHAASGYKIVHGEEFAKMTVDSLVQQGYTKD
ncbi:MAG: hypothetical protein SH868_02230 [Bythopirellula sp.]|nr:hypothetical protein [Bythopirellula sp.]